MESLIESQSPVGHHSVVSWGAIIAGAVVAAAVTALLVTLVSGLGLASVTTWADRGFAGITFEVATGIGLIVTQWLSAAIGGYLAGRLRTRWIGTQAHEVFFRDTAHGLITWAVATLMVVSVLSSSGVPRVSAEASIYSALSMLVGAFIACVAAALGGHLRDQHP